MAGPWPKADILGNSLTFGIESVRPSLRLPAFTSMRLASQKVAYRYGVIPITVQLNLSLGGR
jgi:hypothetical protein